MRSITAMGGCQHTEPNQDRDTRSFLMKRAATATESTPLLTVEQVTALSCHDDVPASSTIPVDPRHAFVLFWPCAHCRAHAPTTMNMTRDPEKTNAAKLDSCSPLEHALCRPKERKKGAHKSCVHKERLSNVPEH